MSEDVRSCVSEAAAAAVVLANDVAAATAAFSYGRPCETAAQDTAVLLHLLVISVADAAIGGGGDGGSSGGTI